MKLRERRRLDHKNRLHIPMEYVEGAGGRPNGDVYVEFDEKTRKIEISFPGGVSHEEKEEADGSGRE